METTKAILCLLSCFAASCASANNSEPLKEPLDSKQRMPVEQRDLSGREFWAAYMSQDVKQRRFAEMYLVGVLDGSEGHVWCGYDQVKGGSIQELLYRKLSTEKEESMSQRASHLITNILANSLPCKKRK